MILNLKFPKMKLLSSIVLSLLIFNLSSCRKEERQITPEPAELQETGVVVYDSVMAESYGADDYGMKKYVMAFLKRGPNRDLDSVAAMELQMAHLQNINKMAEEGKLVLAGPFLDDGEIRGIYIFNVESLEEAEVLTNSDPAIQAGSLEMELKEWYGSAALVGVNDTHNRLMKKGIAE